jgi:hypothetical protein
MAKSGRLGGGLKFEQMKNAIMRSGKSEASAKAIAAASGRKRYGNAKMNQMAQAGRKRAMKHKGLKRMMSEK